MSLEWGVVLFGLALLILFFGSRRRRAPVVPPDEPAEEIWLDLFFSRTCRFDHLEGEVVAYRPDRPELVSVHLPHAVVFAAADGQRTFRSFLEQAVDASSSKDVDAHERELYSMMRLLVSQELIRLHTDPEALPPELQRPVSEQSLN